MLMQVLYLLKTEDWTLSKMRTLCTAGFCNAAFSPDSRFLLLGLRSHLGSDLEIYDSSGHLLCLLKDKGHELPSHVLLDNDRLALAMMHTFQVYSIWSGRLQATRAPHMSERDLEYESLLALNASGSMLAFSTARGPSIFHIFDARTLQELSSICSAGGRPVLSEVSHTEMIWGPYGWMLFPKPSVMNLVTASEHVRVLRPLLGSDSYTTVLRCDDHPQKVPACSPDGSMMCTFSRACDSIEVHDMRCGQLKMRQAIPMPAYGAEESLEEVALDWSACGRWLLAKVFVSKGYHCFDNTLKSIHLVTLYT